MNYHHTGNVSSVIMWMSNALKDRLDNRIVPAGIASKNKAVQPLILHLI